MKDIVKETFNAVSKGIIPNKIKTQAAIVYMRKKIDLPTDSYRDIKASAHKKAFIISGLTDLDLLKYFHEKINKSIEDGGPFSEFKKDFRKIALESGFLTGEKADKKYTNWRSKIIWETNIMQAFHAGKWEDFTSKESVEDYPYLEYRHAYYGNPMEPRVEHKALDGLIFPIGDSFWDNHFGMLNYGCKCGVTRVARWDERVKGRSEADVLSENRSAAGWDEKKGEYPDNGSNGNFVNPGIFDGGGIVSLFEKIEKMRAAGGWQKELADNTWDKIAERNDVFADNLKTWIDRLWTGNEVRDAQTRSIAVLKRDVFEKIKNEYEKKHTGNMPKDILRSPVIFCNGSQLSHAGRTAKSRTVIERNDLYLLSELNNADFEINTERGNVPTVNFFIKSKEDKTVLVVVKNFEKFTANTKNSSIITFYYK